MKRSSEPSIKILITALLLLTSHVAAGQEADEPAQAAPDDSAPDVQTQINALSDLVDTLQSRMDQQSMQLSQQTDTIQRQQQQLDAQTDAIQALQTRIDQTAQEQVQADDAPPELTAEEQAARAQLEDTETTGDVAEQETTTTYDAEEFTGALAIPGTTAAVRLGGFVKTNIVESFAGLGSQNRFIVGTIPTRGPVGSDAEAALTAQQSRLNLELRDETSFGQLRAFVEGDFAGENETFRLRHAFGQFRDFMVGKTWTTFMDVDSAPEEVDFEGINGRINVRQPQVRWFPSVGNNWNLELAMEDPAPDFTGGKGISQIPDVIASIRTSSPRILFSDNWQFKSSLLLRNLRGRSDVDPSEKQKAVGWGLSVSGSRPLLRWDARDNFAMQISYGDGYGRYVNDLGTVGGQDAVFDDTTGEMRTLKALAAYMSFQKWWHDGLRSTFIASYVDVDNIDFQPDTAYNRTARFSGNLIWSPIPRIDIATELLWGKRTDKDGSRGDASQIQISTRYRF